jgi:gliding motility-associated-like protein
VFDRWGELIFEDQNFAPSDIAHGWDGTYQGNLAPAGGYPYQIVAQFKNGEIYTAKGIINLQR